MYIILQKKRQKERKKELFIHDSGNIVVDYNQTADSLPTRLGGRWDDNDGSLSLIPMSVL